MNDIKSYLKARFDKSHWPYHGINQMLYDLRNEATKDELREEIRELRKSGAIDIVGGLNGWLIKIKNI
jgi:hypothetical protein